MLGFVRDMLMTSSFGMGAEFGAFAFAWVIPNLFRRLFGEGAVGAAIQPALARQAKEHGEESAHRLFARFSGWLALSLFVLVLIGEAVLFTQFDGVKSNNEQGLMVLFTILLLPYAMFICMSALATAPQQLHGRFFAPAAAPVILNLIWISCLAWGAFTTADLSRPALLGFLCVAILGAGIIQWLFQLPGVRKSSYPLRPSLAFADGSGRRAVKAFLPAVLGLAAVQLNMAVDQGLVWSLVGPEANSFCYIANRLLQLPLALVAISIATAAMPLFSNLAASQEYQRISRALGRASEASLLLITAAGAGLAVLAPMVLTVLFDHGAYQSADTPLLSLTLRCYLLCLPAAALAGLLTRVRQACGDYRGPARAALWSVPVNLGLDVILLPKIGVPAAGIATAAALTVQVVILQSGLSKLGISNPITLTRLPRLMMPALAAAGSAYLISLLMSGMAELLILPTAIVVGIIGALVACRILLPQELNLLRSRGAGLRV